MSDTDDFEVVPLRAFEDNYIWTLRNRRHAVAVDPGDEQPVLDYLQRERLQLCAILATHHHQDHVGGVARLLEYRAVPVYGPRGESIATLTHPVCEGDAVEIPQLGLRFSVLDIPGHTRGHVAYYGANSLFCGDTLFACGCGRLFEGTAQQMVESLAKLAALPDETLVYSGHEYTLANIDFAKAVEPGNAELLARAASEAQKRKHEQPTLPSTIGREKKTNPFLRCAQAEVIAAADKYLGARASDPVQVFAAIRQWKNKF
ncbi:MAG: hydroxyacylglutathione hydrolase [Pseudomonadota bacterium]